MSQFEQLKAFTTVVEQQSFSKAARQLQVSTPAISKQINQLEHRLQQILLRRTTRKLALTELGQRYYDEVKRTLNNLQTLDETIANQSNDPSGSLGVSTPRYFAKHHILPYLDEFLRRHPKLNFRLDIAERLPNLDENTIHLIWGVSLPGQEDWVQYRLLDTRYVLCASSDYLNKWGLPKQIKELSAHRYITHTMRPNHHLRFKNNLTIALQPYLSFNDLEAMIIAAKQHLGLIWLHDYVVHDELKQGTLVEVLKPYALPCIPVYAYYQQARFPQPKIQAFNQFFTPRLKHSFF